MKYLYSLLLVFSSLTFFAQDLKIVGGDEIFVKAKKGKSTAFEFTIKNSTGSDIVITSMSCSYSEVYLPDKDSHVNISANSKKTLKGSVSPEHNGKQRFRVTLKYTSQGSEKSMGFTIKIDP